MRLRRKHGGKRVGQPATRSGGLFTSSAIRRQSRRLSLSLEQLEPRLAMAGVVINEFLAINSNGLQDQDFQRSDWIELKNTDSAPININGWYLADSVDQWQLPNVTLSAGQHLLVFASGKNRAVVGQELHTNFELNGDGESLKLLMPDGVTVVHAYDPFPEQQPNVSYGLGLAVPLTDMLVDEEASLKVHVPTAASALDSTWFTTGFNDAGWMSGTSGVGFDAEMTTVDFNSFINFNLGTGSTLVMQGLRNTAYIRVPFSVADPSQLLNLQLQMRFEDGFGLYLNGTKINLAGTNAPATLAWNSLASATRLRTSAAAYANFDLSAHRHLLVPGNSNVLAIHGLNRATSSNDFLIDPLLTAQREGPAILGYMVTPTPAATNVQGTLGFVADTKFSVDRGFYDSPFTVQITTDTADAQIRYTVDGTQPTATTGLVYNPAIPPLITTTTGRTRTGMPRSTASIPTANGAITAGMRSMFSKVLVTAPFSRAASPAAPKSCTSGLSSTRNIDCDLPIMYRGCSKTAGCSLRSLPRPFTWDACRRPTGRLWVSRRDGATATQPCRSRLTTHANIGSPRSRI